MKLLTLAAVGVLVLAGALVFRPMLEPTSNPEPVRAAGAAPAAEETSAPASSVVARDLPVIAALEPEQLAEAEPTRAYTVASAADRGQVAVAPPPQTFVGPDGRTHVIGEASPELQAMGDENLRLAVMDEIRNDPEAFALAMNVELTDVQRVAEGKADLPPDWMVR